MTADKLDHGHIALIIERSRTVLEEARTLREVASALTFQAQLTVNASRRLRAEIRFARSRLADRELNKVEANSARWSGARVV